MASACNFAIPQYQCTLQTCCLEQSSFLYIPNFGGNLFFAIYFAVAIALQLWLAWSYRTWGFSISMLMGLIIEVVGYAGRLMLHENPFNANGFLIYLICVTIAPVFISAAMYLSLSRLVILYGEHLSYFKPRTIAMIFMTSDFTSLVLQAAGGGIADTTDDPGTSQSGIDTMIAGLFLQALSLAVFLAYMTYFMLKCRNGVLDMAPGKGACRNSMIFKFFLVSLVVAVLAVFARSIFRVAELWEGFVGELWNNETDFLVLDGAMVALAVLLLTVAHPGIAFREQWHASNWSFRGKSTNIAGSWDVRSFRGSAREK